MEVVKLNSAEGFSVLVETYNTEVLTKGMQEQRVAEIGSVSLLDLDDSELAYMKTCHFRSRVGLHGTVSREYVLSSVIMELPSKGRTDITAFTPVLWIDRRFFQLLYLMKCGEIDKNIDFIRSMSITVKCLLMLAKVYRGEYQGHLNYIKVSDKGEISLDADKVEMLDYMLKEQVVKLAYDYGIEMVGESMEEKYEYLGNRTWEIFAEVMTKALKENYKYLLG